MILLNDEQRQLKETLERFLTEQYAFPTRQKVSESQSGLSQDLWQGAVDLGLLAACLPEEVGGLGGSAVELAIIQEAFGTHLVRSPLSGALSAGLTLARLGRNELLPQLAAGEIKIALAHDEPGDAYGPDRLLCEAKRAGNGFALSGQKSAVPFGGACDHWLVTAQLDGAPALFLVPAKAAGVTLDDYPTHDGGRASDLRFQGVSLSADALLGGEDAVQLAVAVASAALLPEASGACWAVQNQTLDYFKTRKQFGQTLGSFQALQHRIVDVYIECQLAQSMAWDAISALDPKVPAAERAKRIAQAKAFVGRAGRQVGKEGVQLHGGIGMTWDLPIGHYLKRLMAIDSVLGPSDRQLKRLAEGERAR